MKFYAIVQEYKHNNFINTLSVTYEGYNLVRFDASEVFETKKEAQDVFDKTIKNRGKNEKIKEVRVEIVEEE